MSFVHSHSFYTTIDLLCRNMSLALSICQQGTNPNSNALATQTVTKDFSSLIGQVSNAYAQVAPPFVIHPTHTLQSDFDTHNEDNVKEAIKSAMSIKPTDSDQVCGGGVPFKHPHEVDMNVDLDASNADTDDNSSDESSIDVESMLPGQRDNYLKTKKTADGLRRAKLSDETFFKQYITEHT